MPVSFFTVFGFVFAFIGPCFVGFELLYFGFLEVKLLWLRLVAVCFNGILVTNLLLWGYSDRCPFLVCLSPLL